MADLTPFDRAFAFTMMAEAGPVAGVKLLKDGVTMDRHALVDDPADHGGRTAYGIRQDSFDVWNEEQGRPWRDVWTITADEIRAIAYGRYWAYLPQYCPARLGIACFDTAFLHGKTYATKRLQLALGLSADGIVGPRTKSALSMCMMDSASEDQVLHIFLQARDDTYEAIVAHDGSQVRFYKGWEERLHALEDALGMRPTTDPPGRAA